MSSYNEIREKVSVESVNEQRDVAADEQELHPTVKLETQAKVDSEAIEKVAGVDERDHPFGMTLEAEETWEAREWEKAQTRERTDDIPARERGSRRVAARGSQQRRLAFERRRASVDPEAQPGRVDPRERLTREELAAVNQEATRIEREVRESSSRAAIARQLAERVAGGEDVTTATMQVLDAERCRPGTVVPIAELDALNRHRVSVEGRIVELWQSDSGAIAQVGLIADDTGKTKVTSWRRSHARVVEEGERVRIRGAIRNWHNGRVSLALDSWALIEFPERDGRWDR